MVNGILEGELETSSIKADKIVGFFLAAKLYNDRDLEDRLISLEGGFLKGGLKDGFLCIEGGEEKD